ncbi:MAG: ferrous iron transport protein B [Clostridia bacterium]|nr:ferrous iron transport protein B [Clostridia bacterium]
MGLTKQSSSRGAIDQGIAIERRSPNQRVIALAGNPNVGKSTVFNGLTGMKQHTGNWPGKTVTNAQGICRSAHYEYILVDIPGTYSLMAHSPEEEVARDFLCFGAPDAVVVVCDATCLERNLNLVLQTIELCDRVVVCLNLMDEAKRKGIHVDADRLSEQLGVPVVATVAHKKESLNALLSALDDMFRSPPPTPVAVRYPVAIESAVARMQPLLKDLPNSRWIALRLLERDEALTRTLSTVYGDTLPAFETVLPAEAVKDSIVTTLTETAERIAKTVVSHSKPQYNAADRRIDRLLTGRWLGYPLMLLLLALVFWLTITGANYPSTLLANGLFWLEDRLSDLFLMLNAPDWLRGALVHGAYRVLAWVVSVMLPPMAIFFPLFTLLEDVGYLPRVAYNLDHPFRRCRACGKQALTMCMGFGCNAAGVVGCRIIDSPRERLLAILTNNFVPCNGRFPTLIALLTIFFVGSGNSLLSAVLLTAVILLGVLLTFGVTRFLSGTILKGVPSSFTLELPPYRRPQIGRVIVRSLLDRTLFVLGRAAAVAAPAGLLLWILANITVGDASLLAHTAAFLDPFAQLMGLDGAILIAFILGFPANEIVIPIVLMVYLAQGTLTEPGSLTEMRAIFLDNGWTWTTAVSTMLFSLLHWPCSTTLLTIHKETGSLKWTAVAFLLPTLIGILVCILFNALV